MHGPYGCRLRRDKRRRARRPHRVECRQADLVVAMTILEDRMDLFRRPSLAPQVRAILHQVIPLGASFARWSMHRLSHPGVASSTSRCDRLTKCCMQRNGQTDVLGTATRQPQRHPLGLAESALRAPSLSGISRAHPGQVKASGDALLTDSVGWRRPVSRNEMCLVDKRPV